MRIAIGGIACESCTFSPLPSSGDDFRIWRGSGLLALYPFLANETEVEFVPLVKARALPGGPMENAAYVALRGELVSGLRDGGPWDGVYLDLHGALFVQGMTDAEGDLIAAVRLAVGERTLISASYDLHGNVSPSVAAQLDLLTAYRTAPHIDGEQTRQRAVRLLTDCLRGGMRPGIALIPVPLLLPGEKAMTTEEPARALYGRLDEIVRRQGVMDASILVGYAWADERRSGASVVVVGVDEAACWAAAQELAQAMWDQRRAFRFGLPTGSIDETIAQALAAEESTVFISDSGDNVTGGAVGDVPLMLERLVAHNVPSAILASIADAEAVATCVAAGLGEEVSLSLGGKLDPLHGQPLPLEGYILAIDRSEPGNARAVVQVGPVKVIVTQARMAFTTVEQFTRLGLEPLAHKIVAVKLGYLFPELRQIAPLALMALSPGAIYAEVEKLPFKRVRRPIYPLDEGMIWSVGEIPGALEAPGI